MKRVFRGKLLLYPLCGALLAACGGGGSSSSTAFSRAIDANTAASGVPITTSFNGATETCQQLVRDTSSCQSARQALGLSGNWLKFSCNVVEGLATAAKTPTTSYGSAAYVTLTTTSMPDYTSSYWLNAGSYSFSAYGYTVTGLLNALYAAFNTLFPDPGSIGQQKLTMYIPVTPAKATTPQVMPMGAVGMAINGVEIFSSLAANSDNIFAESGSFDQCGGHPAGTTFHYHGEPYSISYDDNQLIGVMRDGFFIYGRKNYNGTVPGSTANIESKGASSDIYVYGGDVGPDPVTGSGSTFHYHLTEWQGCYHESGATKYANDGETNDTLNTPSGSSCTSGILVDTWMLTGHGNGGVFAVVPSTGIGTQAPSQTAAGVRYYYGTPGP